jgi:cellulose synthase/poly-beta-1,6-N-acetylglucosamine synthase-like glycosyltransferase
LSFGDNRESPYFGGLDYERDQLERMALLTGLILLFFNVRRWLFLWAAWLKADKPLSGYTTEKELPSVLLLIPFYNEEAKLPGLLAELAQLRYPSDKLTAVLINDGSTDASMSLGRDWLASAKPGPNWSLLSLDNNVGKAAALNAALSQYSAGEVVAVYDADERPRPDALLQLLQPFAEAQVGSVSGRRAVSNPSATLVASYATFENLVHQRVTMQAKDKLGLAPAVLGSNCAYRRQTLAAVGGFRPGALLEDSDLSVKLARAGWQSRFVPTAISYHAVPDSLDTYWRQHVRWASGFNAVAQEQGAAVLRASKLPWLLRLELLAFSLGYLDRPVLAAALGFCCWPRPAGISGRARRPLLAILLLALLTPLLQVILALHLESASPALWLRVLFLPLFFFFDVAAASLTLLKSVDARFHHFRRRNRRTGFGL